MFPIMIADVLVVLHLTFIIFVVAGGFLTLKWRRLTFLHLPAALWGAFVEFSGWLCPLTPIEQKLRRAGSAAGYSGTFIEHYLLPVIYPADLTREIQIFLGVCVVAINMVAYILLISQILHGRHQ
jgi:hypothetical protein